MRRPLASLRARRDPESAYFERLGLLTGGNPRQALYYWLRTVMLDAERTRLQAEDASADARTRSATAFVDLYKSLAGGWPEREPR